MDRQEKYLILRNRNVLMSPAYWNLIPQTSLESKSIHGDIFETEFNIIQGDRMQVIFYSEQWQRVGLNIAQKLWDDDQYFNLVEQKQVEVAENIFSFIEQAKKLTFADLAFSKLNELIIKIYHHWVNYDKYNVPPWFIGGDFYREMVFKELGISETDFLTMTTPLQKTYVSQLEEELPFILLKYRNNPDKEKELAQYLSDKYGWIPYGYDGPEYWDMEYFINKFKQETKTDKELLHDTESISKVNQDLINNHESLISRNDLTDAQKLRIEKINKLNIWTDERKMLEFRLHYWYGKILLEIGRRLNITYKRLKYLFVEEFKDLETEYHNLAEIAQDRIDSRLVLQAKQGIVKELSGIEKDNFLNEFDEQCARQANVKEIKGKVASPGLEKKYKGTVKVVLHPNESDKVKDGDFIVSSMTTPDYMVAMKRAIGFITDEGGVTCHAAIVAREMNKPAIIATRNATQILKDGDMVEVDVDNGKIKVL